MQTAAELKEHVYKIMVSRIDAGEFGRLGRAERAVLITKLQNMIWE